jgi:hypothetical protein
VDGSDRLLATQFNTGNVYDVTLADDYSAASPMLWNLEGFGDTTLDSVPQPPPVVPALGVAALGILSGLLLIAARRALRL